MEDIISFRNAILLKEALKKERIRDVTLCLNGFNIFMERFPWMCKFKTSSLYETPRIAHNYPSEILPKRLYLGD